MTSREKLVAANKTFNRIELKRKDRKTGKEIITYYAPVHERVKAFRIMSPKGRIVTEMVDYNKTSCLFKATIVDEDGKTLATSHAYECEGSSIVNKTSLIENAETSAVGRALGVIGLDVNVSDKDVKTLAEANANIATTQLKGGREYPVVDERIGAFRTLYPNGSIETQIVFQDDTSVVFSATAYDSNGELLATATACESQEDSGVNQYGWIENAETSAIGRCLAYCGFGIDVSIASANEMEDAASPVSEEQKARIAELLESTGVNPERLLEHYKVSSMEVLDEGTATRFITTLEAQLAKMQGANNAILAAANNYTAQASA